jgi:DNA polymerase III sliding clamp (beta) subunit (PCNA family)
MVSTVDTTAMSSSAAMLEIKIDRVDNEREIDLDCRIPAHELLSLVKCPKADRSYVEIHQNTFDVSVVLDSGKFTFPVLDGRDFPIAPSNAGLPICTYYDAKDLASCLDFVLPASSTDETRPHINSICFEGEKLISTDGCRLHAAATSVALNGQHILSRKHAIVLRAMCDCSLIKPHVAVQLRDQANAKAGDGLFFFSSIDVTFIASMMTSDFPPWEQVVPARDDVYTVWTKAFTTAVKKAPVESDKNAGLRLVMNGTIKIEVQTHDRQSSVEVKPIHCADRNVTIGLCARYLKEAIDTVDDTLMIQVNGKLDPIVVRHGRGSFAVLMPMRI